MTARHEPPRYDAGNRTLDHYQSKLPDWRYRLRCSLIPVVRWETPYLAYVQDALRTPALDSYFAFTANLGTHTFFMIMLPILFWCGYTNLGKA
ncbi:putative sphingosine-1-phosphate phosphohydrolase [Diplodia seriata]|uniref:Long-chain base-1-phosphate phosphatase n=2 Tax=Diplodia TaxID=66735 RepID=A0ABR3U5F3_9PEZI|nr:putative sphingosine-1-phosphate phosphohydrolase [Diplodia seriata]